MPDKNETLVVQPTSWLKKLGPGLFTGAADDDLIMALMMMMAVRPEIMGRFVISTRLQILGWLGTAVMLVVVLAMFLTPLISFFTMTGAKN